MIYSLLKNRKHTLKVRKNNQITIVKSVKFKSNSFITKSKIKKFQKIKRFNVISKYSGHIIHVNPNIAKVRYLLKR